MKCPSFQFSVWFFELRKLRLEKMSEFVKITQISISGMILIQHSGFLAMWQLTLYKEK